MIMQTGDRVAIVCCSNGQSPVYQEKIEQLKNTLESIGLIPVFGDYIYAKENGVNGSGIEKAKSLMEFYKEQEIKAIFDISGGDMANEILPYLDFEVIGKSEKQFWGYSDLTTIINAIYSKTGKSSVLYQIRNLVYKDKEGQRERFEHSCLEDKSDLYDVKYKFVQGTSMDGIVVGGNIRCLLKLAGTEYWPDMNGKILLLEAYSGKLPQLVTYLSQLKQLGVFDKISGIILGTFTEYEKDVSAVPVTDLIKEYVPEDMPIAATKEIGHGTDSKAIRIGEMLSIKKHVIKVIGDSLAAGAGSSRSTETDEVIFEEGGRIFHRMEAPNGWTSLLEKYLSEKYGNYEVVNKGCCGAATYQIDMFLDDLVLEDDEIVIVLMGANDRKRVNGLEELKENCTNVIERLLKKGKKVIVLTPTPSTYVNEHRVDRLHRTTQIVEILREKLAGKDIIFIDNYKYMLEYLEENHLKIDDIMVEESCMSDGLHPPDAVQRLIFENVVKNMGL